MKKQGFTIERPKNENEPMKIIFSGDLSINSLGDIVPAFQDVFATNLHMKLLIKDVDNIDLAFLQFLISVQKTAKQLNKSLQMEFKLDEENRMILKNAGFDFLLQNNTGI